MKKQITNKLGLHSKLEDLNGVGPAKAKLLREVGLNTASDLLDYWPRRYIDYSNLILIKNIQPGLIA